MHTSKSEAIQTLKDVKLREGETKRINCPFCGGRNTFTITRKEGVRVWNCYKASCTASGATGDTRSLKDIQMSIKDKKSPIQTWVCPLPDLSVPISQHPYAVKYLESVNALQACVEGLVEVSYAPREHRVLFWLNSGTGAVGRSLKGQWPKWKAYGDVSGLFKCGSGSTAVVVEDAASACAVGVLPGYTGVALMGTHIDPIKKRQLAEYDRVIICLDNDATRKGLQLVRKMEGFVPTTIKFLGDDLKWLNQDQIKQVLL